MQIKLKFHWNGWSSACLQLAVKQLSQYSTQHALVPRWPLWGFTVLCSVHCLRWGLRTIVLHFILVLSYYTTCTWHCTFTLTGEIPMSNASSMDLITLSHPLLREINSNFWGTSVSRLIFRPRRPFSYSGRSLWDKVKPLVVIATESRPGNDANEPGNIKL